MAILRRCEESSGATVNVAAPVPALAEDEGVGVGVDEVEGTAVVQPASPNKKITKKNRIGTRTQ